jgi:predicted anti-sigma-YlaC factor YlaD
MSSDEECTQIGDLLPEFMAGRVSPADEQRIRAHLEGCAGCRARANAVSLLQHTPVPVPDPDRWECFVSGVVDAAERRRKLVGPRRIWTLVAIIVALAVAVFLWVRFAT